MTSNQLKGMNVVVTSIDDLILARHFLKVLDQGYVELEMETPEWILDNLTLVITELTNRNWSELQKKLKAAKARRSALATPDEKRTNLDNEISNLEKKLGKPEQP